MKRSKIPLKFCKGDVLIIVFVVMLAILTGILFDRKVNAETAKMAVVYKDGEKMQELSLNEDAEVKLTYEYTNLIQIKDGKVSIVESDCPGEDCVHSGWISETGRSIVCLPNRVEIRMEGEADVDFILR